jgi:hypothetical protein
VSGSYQVPVLPDVGFTATIDETLALTTPPGQDVAMTCTSTPHVDAGVGLDSAILQTLLTLLNNVIPAPIPGLAAFIGSGYFANNAAAGTTGAGASLASQWPAGAGQIRFFWNRLTVDPHGVRTTGTNA